MNDEQARTDPQQAGPQEGRASSAGPQEAQPSEEELRARVEEQLRRVRIQDLLLESAVSVINLAARRIAKEDERDLEQARVGIEAVRGIVDLLDPEPAKQVRGALSEVQVLYAKQAGAGVGAAPGGGEAKPAAGQEQPPSGGTRRGPSKLWTPPGT